ncbi:sensor domain-containing diguanylate cyclase [Paenibacillus koleovorans]|uniref:sensor domain-containing diguanylate cyclase n=1 Tax=Paenibacillus koleovorans TaxID=121608 RepID=UPI000FDB1A56|nr:sensor domain-containing diguanylate cyclase [Paenibacillus koleovorans]
MEEDQQTAAPWTDAFHTMIDELMNFDSEETGTVSLLGPDGAVWAMRDLRSGSSGRQAEPPIETEHEPVTIVIDSIPISLTLQLGAGRARDARLLLQAMASALTAKVRLTRERNGLASTDAALERMNQAFERQNTLFLLTKRLHEQNDVNAILTEWIKCLNALYPELEKKLYVAQDHLCPEIPVTPLVLYDDDHLCSRAFMQGKLVFEDADRNGRLTAGVPLKGKQGVYGVLQLTESSAALSGEDWDYISLLTDTAGTAFENAQLFGQTVRLVQELQLINEISHRLNQSLKLQDIYQFAVEELMQLFQAEFVCILELDKQKNELVVRASRPESFMRERVSLDYGFAGLVISKKEPVMLADYRSDCPVDSVWMNETEARSLLASPMMDHGEAIGAILVAHRQPNHFSYNNYKLLQVLSTHFGLTISNANLHAEMRRMVATDHLTGLFARHYLDEHIAMFQKRDACGSLVLLDIDNFKKINDSHGHQIGDHVLIQVSKVIKSCIRDGDIAARWGGEELAIYFPKVSREQAVHVAERICNKVRLETTPQVTVSCGVSDWAWSDAKLSVETLFYRADMALYKAKRSGKNQIRQG